MSNGELACAHPIPSVASGAAPHQQQATASSAASGVRSTMALLAANGQVVAAYTNVYPTTNDHCCGVAE
jgi:hypothetical protein